MADETLDTGGMGGDDGLASSSVDQQQAPPQALAQTIMGGMGNGMGPSVPQQPSAGVQAVRKHGGLLTGLVGVLLDGLSAGVRTPQGPNGFSQSAQMAAQMPMQRQQQQMNFQSQQELQRAQLAQAHVQEMQTRLLASTLNDEAASGLSDAAWKSITKSVEEGNAEQVSGAGTREAAADKWKELHDQAPDGEKGNLYMYPAGKKDGETQWAVYKTFPNGTSKTPEPYHLDGTISMGGKIPDLDYTFPAGMTTAAKTALRAQLTRDHITKVHDESQQMIAANKSDPTKTVPRVVGGKDHTILVNARTGEDIKDLGEAPAKPTAPKPEKPEDMSIGSINGHQVAGTVEELHAAGIKTGITKAGQGEAEKIINARGLINLFDSKDTDDPGLVQLAADLDKKGKLGPAAISFAQWLNQGRTLANFNAGDDEVQRLFTKIGLATTGLMQVHVGAKGSAEMLEHFERLAQAKQMSASAFRTALDTESRYVRMKAMRPDDVKARYGRDFKTAERNKVALTDLPVAQ